MTKWSYQAVWIHIATRSMKIWVYFFRTTDNYFPLWYWLLRKSWQLSPTSLKTLRRWSATVQSKSVRTHKCTQLTLRISFRTYMVWFVTGLSVALSLHCWVRLACFSAIAIVWLARLLLSATAHEWRCGIIISIAGIKACITAPLVHLQLASYEELISVTWSKSSKLSSCKLWSGCQAKTASVCPKIACKLLLQQLHGVEWVEHKWYSYSMIVKVAGK